MGHNYIPVREADLEERLEAAHQRVSLARLGDGRIAEEVDKLGERLEQRPSGHGDRRVRGNNSIPASPTARPLRGYWRAGTQMTASERRSF